MASTYPGHVQFVPNKVFKEATGLSEHRYEETIEVDELARVTMPRNPQVVLLKEQITAPVDRRKAKGSAWETAPGTLPKAA